MFTCLWSFFGNCCFFQNVVPYITILLIFDLTCWIMILEVNVVVSLFVLFTIECQISLICHFFIYREEWFIDFLDISLTFFLVLVYLTSFFWCFVWNVLVMECNCSFFWSFIVTVLKDFLFFKVSFNVWVIINSTWVLLVFRSIIWAKKITLVTIYEFNFHVIIINVAFPFSLLFCSWVLVLW